MGIRSIRVDTASSWKIEARNCHREGSRTGGWLRFRFRSNELIGERPVMTIQDSDLHPDDHFESHLSGNGHSDDCHRK